MSRSLAVVALGTALWLLSASSLLADDSPAAASQIRTGQAAIEEELAKPIDLDFLEAPLLDVIEHLKDRCKIEICFDYLAMADVGIQTDTPVTIDLHSLPLRSALNLVLRQLRLTWNIRDDVLLITTPEEAESVMITKVYDVADLVVCQNSEGELWDDFDRLINTINAAVMPITWDQVGGPGCIAPANFGTAKAIVVLQTYQAHCEIVDLLAAIRAIAKENLDGKLPRQDNPRRMTDAERQAEEKKCSGTKGGAGIY